MKHRHAVAGKKTQRPTVCPGKAVKRTSLQVQRKSRTRSGHGRVGQGPKTGSVVLV